MIGTVTQLFDIQNLRSVQPTNGAWVVTFPNGLVARFSPDDPEHGRILREAEYSLQQHRPVGILVNGDGRCTAGGERIPRKGTAPHCGCPVATPCHAS
jgi:hypothetical protein